MKNALTLILLLSVLCCGCGDNKTKEVHTKKDTPTTPVPDTPKPNPVPTPTPPSSSPQKKPEKKEPMTSKKRLYLLAKNALMNWYCQLDNESRKILNGVFLLNKYEYPEYEDEVDTDMNAYINNFISFCDSHALDCAKEIDPKSDTTGIVILLVGLERWWWNCLANNGVDRGLKYFFGKTIPIIIKKLQ
jgi:hypothetical protein